MGHISIFEFDALVASTGTLGTVGGLHLIPPTVFEWLDLQARRQSEQGGEVRLRPVSRGGQRAVQVTSQVGVIRAPGGFQIEVLPKIGKANENGVVDARRLLIEMLRSLSWFRHIRTQEAALKAARMPFLEIFVSEFLESVEYAVHRGLRGDYSMRSGNLAALRGKLSIPRQIRQNLLRRDRFFVDYDEFSVDRPENRLLHSALLKVLGFTSVQEHQKLARELVFAFSEVPVSNRPNLDFAQVRRDRGMEHYQSALSWARLILDAQSPLTGLGEHEAPSLLFPMEALFESFVADQLRKRLRSHLALKTQVRAKHLVRHGGMDWFQLKPDILFMEDGRTRMVLDTKWKLLDSNKSNGTEKYDLSADDFYQLHGYGTSYLEGEGEMILIYPKTSKFQQPVSCFEYSASPRLRLWVVPFCLDTKQLVTVDAPELHHILDEFMQMPSAVFA